MSTRSPTLRERIEILRATGVPVSSADEKRVGDSIAASLVSLDSAVKGSLFDTEPQTFDVVMRKLAKPTGGKS
jgi:hypothetical protein